MWLGQSLRYISYIANKGAPILLFLQMIFYLLPNLIVIVSPIAVLIGILFVYNKLISDHELIVMRAAGAGHWQLAKPAIFVSGLVTVVLYAFTLYILPLSFRENRELTVTLKEKSLVNLVKIGQFNTQDKYTIYARSQDEQGNFLGVLIYDSTQVGKSLTFMAEKGVILNNDEGGRILLMNGSRQEKEYGTGKPSILYFDQYIIETNEKTSNEDKGDRILKTYERFLGDLLNPSPDLSPAARSEYITAAHQRILSPLFALAFGFISICAMLLGHYDRKGRALNITIACILSLFVEYTPFIFFQTFKHSDLKFKLSYGVVIITIIICSLLLTPWTYKLSPLRFWRKS